MTLTGHLIIEGNGDCQAQVRDLAAAFEEMHPGVKVVVPESIGSKSGLIALTKGKCDLARIARPLNESDVNAGIRAEPFALTPLVFVVNAANRDLTNLSRTQVADIYRCRATSQAQLGLGPGKIYPLGREISDVLFVTLKEGIPGFAAGSESCAKAYYTTQELLDDVAEHPGAIGYAALSMVVRTSSVVPLELDGMIPTPENAMTGAYPLHLVYSLAWVGQPSPLARAFVDFTHSPKAAKIIAAQGSAPLKPGNTALK